MASIYNGLPTYHMLYLSAERKELAILSLTLMVLLMTLTP